MSAATAADWLPKLKEAVDRASHGNGGPSSRPDAEIDSALAKAISVLPKDWELLCLRGVVRAGRSDFAAADEDFERAAKLAPSSPKPLTDRAYLRTRLGDWAGALADLDRALPLSNGAASLRFERALVLLSLGEASKAKTELEAAAAAGFRGPETDYQRGRAELAAGRPAEAAALFAAARKESQGRPERAKLFAAFEAAAVGDQVMKKKPAAKAASAKSGAKGRLWLLGVGIERPYEITLNTIMALRACGAAYTQNDTREVRELLETVFPGLKTIPVSSGRGADPQAATWKAVKADLDKGLEVAYVTYGHPMLFGEGNMMAKKCKEAGYGYRVVTAPSSIDGILTMLQDDLDLCERGFSVQNGRSVVAEGAALDPRRGAIVLGINRLMEENRFGAFCDALVAAYGAGHPVHALKCGDGYREETRVALTAGTMKSKERELDPASTLFIPEKR